MKILPFIFIAFLAGCQQDGIQIDSGGGSVEIVQTESNSKTDVRAGGEGAEIGSVQDSSDNSDNSITDNSDNSDNAGADEGA